MLFGILLILFILVCVFICFIILIQSDKGGGISGAIGGLSGANNFLGTQDTANVLTKGTYIFGAIFLVLCILMTFSAPGGGIAKSGMQKRAEKVQTVTPTPSGGFGMDFSDDAGAPTGAAAVLGDEAATSGGPVIVGDIMEGGVIKKFEDGELKEVGSGNNNKE